MDFIALLDHCILYLYSLNYVNEKSKHMMYICKEMQQPRPILSNFAIYAVTPLELEDYLLAQIKNYRKTLGLDFKVDRLYNKDKKQTFEYTACDVNKILLDLFNTKVFDLNVVYSVRVVKSQEWIITIGY